MNKLYCFTGASAVGKSTLLDYVRDNFNVHVSEVSAREYLPTNTDYVNGLTEESQVLITQNRFMAFVEGLIYSGLPMLYSRSPIDSLAYEQVLHKAPFIEDLLIRQVRATSNVIKYIYIPVEFDMKEEGDTIRGTNVDVQKATDEAIKRILKENNISYVTVKGSKAERFAQIDEIFKGHEIEVF